jgi:hypothetical protein
MIFLSSYDPVSSWRYVTTLPIASILGHLLEQAVPLIFAGLAQPAKAVERHAIGKNIDVMQITDKIRMIRLFSITRFLLIIS